MTTASTNTVIDHTSDAGFRTWGNELMTMLITTLGLTQTADTGQLAFPMTATTRPGTNTAAGYYILRFNDTLQATTPIYIKIELGTAASAAVPNIWLTVGTGSNGSGTISGASTRVACGYSSGPLSTVTNYTSRACYNATQGTLWINWKQTASIASACMFDFHVCRSVDNTGAPTSTAIGFQGQSTTATAGSNNGGPWQWYNASSTAWLGPANTGGQVWNNWAYVPYSAAGTIFSTIVGTAGQVFPVFQYAPTASAPAHGVTNQQALCYNAEIGIGSTVSLTILGSTTLTYIGIIPCASSIASNAYSSTVVNILRVWQ
jgi:hypothetical protein